MVRGDEWYEPLCQPCFEMQCRVTPAPTTAVGETEADMAAAQPLGTMEADTGWPCLACGDLVWGSEEPQVTCRRALGFDVSAAPPRPQGPAEGERMDIEGEGGQEGEGMDVEEGGAAAPAAAAADPATGAYSGINILGAGVEVTKVTLCASFCWKSLSRPFPL